MHDHSITIPLPPDIAERDRVRRAALRAARVAHPGLSGIDAHIVPGGVSLAYDVPDGSGPLSQPLTAPEALAILAPVAGGLALLHDAGVAHGGVEVDRVRRTPGGAGVLVGWRPDGNVARDLEGLVSVAHALLPSGSVGADVAQALVWAADPDPSGVPEERRTMARLASVLESARRRLTALPAGDAEVPPSPPALRRSPAVDPGSAFPGMAPAEAAPAEATPSDATPSEAASESGPRGVPPRSSRRARHAAHSAVSTPRWRWLLAAAGAVVVAVTAVGAMRAADAQSAAPDGVCAATVAAE
ncbi:MAG: hypothetical protein ACKOT0_10290 [bacterium]